MRVTLDNIDDLRGMVFESNISIEVHNGIPYVITSDRNLISKPVMQETKAFEAEESEGQDYSFWY